MCITTYWNTGPHKPAGCRITTAPDGTVRFASATNEVGNGVRTVMTQVAADATGLAPAQVAFDSGDSLFPDAPYSGASQTTATVGSAVHQAGQQWKRRLVEYLAADAACDPNMLDIAGGLIVSIDQSRPATPVVDALRQGGSTLLDLLTFEVTSAGAPQDGSVSQSFGAQFCEVEVDEQIGRATVTRWVAVFDCGRVLNPKLARNQVMGGITFGVGMALLEQVPYDVHTAQLI